MQVHHVMAHHKQQQVGSVLTSAVVTANNTEVAIERVRLRCCGYATSLPATAG